MSDYLRSPAPIVAHLARSIRAPLCFVDVEADGLANPWDEHGPPVPWEVAVIRRPPGMISAWVYAMCVDEVDEDRTPGTREALRYGGYYDRHPVYNGGLYDYGVPGVQALTRMLSEADMAEVVAHLLAPDPTSPPTHIVGLNPAYDVQALGPVLHRHGYPWAASYHLVDLSEAARGYLAAQGEHVGLPYRSDDVIARLGIERPASRHTALGDALHAMVIYDRIYGKTDSEGTP